MTSSVIADAISLAMIAALLLAGAAVAWSAANVAKRVVGLIVAHVAAVLGLALLGAPPQALMAGVVIAFAYCAVGVAVLVRLQEGYASTETAEIDVADAHDEPAEPGV